MIVNEPKLPQWWRTLPNGKAISALGFGCASVWASPGFTDWRAVFAAARAGEVNYFDTSPSYGPEHGEERLGELISGLNRDDLVISSKTGTNSIDGRVVRSFDPAIMQVSFDRSMIRLGLDHLDILYLHGPAPRDLNAEIFGFFDRLKAAGRITYSGVNSFDRDTLKAVINSPIDAVMLQFNIDDQSCADLIDALCEAGKIVISGTALARAKFRLSSFIPRDRASAWYLARMLRRNPAFIWEGARLRRRMALIAQPPETTAIQFVTGHPGITSTLFGTRNAAHAESNARAGHGYLNGSDLEKLVARQG